MVVSDAKLVDFPPFYTLQPNLETRKKQTDAWIAYCLTWAKKHNQFELALPVINQDTNMENSPFVNTKINRKLSSDAFSWIVGEAVRSGRGDALGGDFLSDDMTERKRAKCADEPLTWRCYDKQRLADEIWAWAVKTGKKGSVETLFGLCADANDDLSCPVDEWWMRMPRECVLGGLRVLEGMSGRIELIQSGEGVKFL